MIDHICLPVSDLNRSSEFYKKVLEPLGIDMPYKFDRLLGFAINSDPGFWLKNGEVAKDLYVAFTAKSADAVRASYKAAIDAEGTDPSARMACRLLRGKHRRPGRIQHRDCLQALALQIKGKSHLPIRGQQSRRVC